MSRSNLILYWSKTKVFLPFFVSLTCFTYHYKCRGFLLRLISLKDTHTLCRTPLDERSARWRDLYLKIHNKYK